MRAAPLLGRPVADAWTQRLARRAAALTQAGRPLSLAVLRFAQDPAARAYASRLLAICVAVGIGFREVVLPSQSSTAHALMALHELNADAHVTGILPMLPAPPQVDASALVAAIDPDKDVDGAHPRNAAALYLGTHGCSPAPATSLAILELLRAYGERVAGRDAVVVGLSNVVGKPLALGLLRENAAVTLCDWQTANLADHTRRADLLVVATGRPGLITGDMVGAAATVVDVGTNYIDGRLVGDVLYEEVAERVARLTPVPGGVGPLTNVMLVKNLLDLAERRARPPIGRSRSRVAGAQVGATLQEMKPTAKLHASGQSLWLDNISREMLDSGQLRRYIDEYSVTGLTSNPSIFDKAIASGAYDDEIRRKAPAEDPEALFFELAIEDLRRAADLFEPIHQRTGGVDGWVSLEVSPLLAHDASRTVQEAAGLHARAGRRNLFIKIPGTEAGLAAIEESIFAGVPINVTLLFSREQYLAAADAYMRGIERRLAAGLDLHVDSVASVFMSRWDAAVLNRVPDALRGRLAIAVGLKTYQAYRELMDSDRWQRLANEGARLQRLLWASTSTKDPQSPDTLYVSSLSAPRTIDTMPETTLVAFDDHGTVDAPMPTDGGDADSTLAEFQAAGVDVAVLAAKLQSDGASSFTDSWTNLLKRIGDQVAAIRA